MPVDLSEFDELAVPNRLKRCVIARSADRLSDEDRAKLEAALAAHYAHGTIARWLKARGLDGRDDAVKLHRDGDCCCERS